MLLQEYKFSPGPKRQRLAAWASMVRWDIIPELSGIWRKVGTAGADQDLKDPGMRRFLLLSEVVRRSRQCREKEKGGALWKEKK